MNATSKTSNQWNQIGTRSHPLPGEGGGGRDSNESTVLIAGPTIVNRFFANSFFANRFIPNRFTANRWIAVA